MEVCTNCTTLSSSSSGEVIRLLNSVAKNSATSSLKKADCRAEDDPPLPPPVRITNCPILHSLCLQKSRDNCRTART